MLLDFYALKIILFEIKYKEEELLNILNLKINQHYVKQDIEWQVKMYSCVKRSNKNFLVFLL